MELTFLGCSRISGITVHALRNTQNNSNSNYHAIVVDMRTFNMGMSDFGDFMNIVYGSKDLPDVYKRYWVNEDGKKELVRGLFDPKHPDKRSKRLRENIHAIGFIKEKCYEVNEINSIIKLYANTLLISQEEMRKLWPLESNS